MIREIAVACCRWSDDSKSIGSSGRGGHSMYGASALDAKRAVVIRLRTEISGHNRDISTEIATGTPGALRWAKESPMSLHLSLPRGFIHKPTAARSAEYSLPLEYARRFWQATRRWWWSAYWRLDVRGLEHVPRRGPVLLCANHTSHLDAPAILASLPRNVALRTSTAAAKDVFGEKRSRVLVSRIMTNSLPIQRCPEAKGFAKGLRELEAVLRDRR